MASDHQLAVFLRRCAKVGRQLRCMAQAERRVQDVEVHGYAIRQFDFDAGAGHAADPPRRPVSDADATLLEPRNLVLLAMSTCAPTCPGSMRSATWRLA